jgi:hypothetical protein
MFLRLAAPFAAAALLFLATVLPSAAGGDTLTNARDATAAFSDPAAALAAGYELLTDSAGLACIDQPGAGAMGVHYVKGPLVQSGTLDPARPQALVYEVQPDGQLRLAALEYVVFKDAWDSAHSGPPTLFGQQFMLNSAENRYGLPAFYALHAWVWKSNPSGTFSSWNPSVQCGAPLPGDVAGDQTPGPAPMADARAAFVCPVPAGEPRAV